MPQNHKIVYFEITLSRTLSYIRAWKPRKDGKVESEEKEVFAHAN